MSLFQSLIKTLVHRHTKTQEAVLKIAQLCTETLGIPIPPEAVTLEKTRVFLHVSPTIKTALVLKRQRIIESCKANHIILQRSIKRKRLFYRTLCINSIGTNCSECISSRLKPILMGIKRKCKRC